MKYYLLPLKFLTPVHFGDVAEGGNLEKVTFTCHGDTLVSAMINEAAAMGENYLADFVNKCRDGKIVFSSMLPYRDNQEERHLYLPKPLLLKTHEELPAQSSRELKDNATKMKKQKKVAYIRAAEMSDFLHSGMVNTNVPKFALPMLATRVNKRLEEPLPYYVGAYCFQNNTGLYFICGVENTEDIKVVEELTELLGLSGIGGKRSSGFGKFTVIGTANEHALDNSQAEDAAALAIMLNNKASKQQMCLAPVYPLEEEIALVKKGAYKILKRSGFIVSARLTDGVKRNSIYMLAEGSCFPKRLQGCFTEQEYDGLAHKIYRDGQGLFVGLIDNETK